VAKHKSRKGTRKGASRAALSYTQNREGGKLSKPSREKWRLLEEKKNGQYDVLEMREGAKRKCLESGIKERKKARHYQAVKKSRRVVLRGAGLLKAEQV